MAKIKLALIFGGRSTEHEISILSATSIFSQLDKERYEVLLLKIDIQGQWFLVNGDQLTTEDATQISVSAGNPKARIHSIENGTVLGEIDVAFPVLHGTFGEDGTIQGFLKVLNVPFVGCDVLASSACIDKAYTKKLLVQAGVQVSPGVIVTKGDDVSFEEIEAKFGLPLFVKPANLGSSVGVHKVGNREEFETGLADALRYDTKVLVEQNIVGREIECAVLGNENPEASLPGEIILNSEFYSFESKYVDGKSSGTQIPAELPDHIVQRIREIALKGYRALGCEGMARVDFFLTADEQLIINEINTIPGFTKISMYPKMWEATGLPYTQLLDRLIELALERHQRDSALRIVATKVE